MRQPTDAAIDAIGAGDELLEVGGAFGNTGVTGA
jgi:hypothetical protein